MTEFFRSLLKVRKKVIFRKYRGVIGFCEFGCEGKILVAIKARRVSPAQIYLHELIHAIRPSWSETQVLYMERYLWKRLTAHERYLLYKKLFRHPYVSRDDD